LVYVSCRPDCVAISQKSGCVCISLDYRFFQVNIIVFLFFLFFSSSSTSSCYYCCSSAAAAMMSLLEYNNNTAINAISECAKRKPSSFSGGTESRWKQRGACLTLPTSGRAYRLQPADVVPVPVRSTSRPSSTVVGHRSPPPPALLSRPSDNRASADDPVDDADRFFLVTDV